MARRVLVSTTEWRPYFNTEVLVLKNPQSQRPMAEVAQEALLISALLGFEGDEDVERAFHRAIELLEAHHGYENIEQAKRMALHTLLALRFATGEFEYSVNEQGEVVSAFKDSDNFNISYVASQFGLGYIDVLFIVLVELIGYRLGALNRRVLSSPDHESMLTRSRSQTIELADALFAALVITKFDSQEPFLPEDYAHLVVLSMSLRASGMHDLAIHHLRQAASLNDFLSALRGLTPHRSLYFSWTYITQQYLRWRRALLASHARDRVVLPQAMPATSTASQAEDAQGIDDARDVANTTEARQRDESANLSSASSSAPAHAFDPQPSAHASADADDIAVIVRERLRRMYQSTLESSGD